MCDHQPWCPEWSAPDHLAAQIMADQPQRALCPWPPEPVTMSWTAQAKARRAQKNRDYVRKLLSQRQPEFAAALAFAEQELTCQTCGMAEPGRGLARL
jgi:hypothetical protein